MKNKKKSFYLFLFPIFLIVAFVLPTNVCASSCEIIQPRESPYLSTYGAYVYLAGDGLVQVYFNVQGTGTMDELGVLSISLYESKDGSNWTWKKTFTHDSTAGMLSYNDNFHSSHVEYQGIEGRYYKAYVCVWGGKDGKGDTRYFWTLPQPDLP